MNNEKRHIPAGYKSSPLGIIPEDWEVKRLGEIFSFKNGINANKDSYGEGIKFVNTMDVLNNNYISSESLRGKVNINDKTKNEFLVSIGDVLFNRTSETREEVGCSAVYKDSEEAVFGGFIIRAHDIKSSTLDLLYKGYCFQPSYIRNQISALGNGAIRYNLGQEDLSRVNLLIPPLPEQRRIVSVLSLWDTAISKQTALIEKLTIRKKGLMQQLLTGKKKLKGFEGEWKEVRLGDVASINRGGSPRPIEDYITDGDGYNWIKIGDVGVDAKYITRTEEKIIKEGLSKTRFVKSGDFILSNSMSFGRPYILKIDGCIHDGWLVIQEYDKTFNIDFLYYILGYDTTLAQYKSMAAGSGVLNLNKEIVKEVMLKTPSIDEQKAIATILVESDKEIELANKKLTRLQEEKKGLMQVLLTGKRRVK